jgi:hypothetical protein
MGVGRQEARGRHFAIQRATTKGTEQYRQHNNWRVAELRDEFMTVDVEALSANGAMASFATR